MNGLRALARLARNAAVFTTVLGGALLVGCASTSPARAFRDTAQLVADRTGQRIFWDQGGTDDAAVAKKLHELLSGELTADAAVQVALLNNKDLQAIYEDLSVAQADLVQAGLLQNPVFGASLAIPVAGQGVTPGFGLSVTQDFLSVFLLSARKKVAGARLEATKRRVGDAVVRMGFEAERAYCTLQAAEQTLAMRQTILEAGQAALDLARRQHEAGNISDLDLATERTLEEQVRTDVKRSAGEVLVAREALTTAMGLWGPERGFVVPAHLPEPPAEELPPADLESLAIGRRLDLDAAREDLRALVGALAMARSGRFLGAANLGASFERSPEGYSVAGPTASLELPVFDQRRAAIARLEALVRQAKAREGALAIGIRSEVRIAAGRVHAARELVDQYANVVVPLREEVVALSQKQYGAMLLGAYQLFAAKQAEVNAYRELIEALRDYWIARADLERATGGALPAPRPAARSPGGTR